MMNSEISNNCKKPPPDPIYTFKGKQTQVHSLAYLLNTQEEKLLVGTRNGKIHVWDFQTRRQVYEFATAKTGSCISILNTGSGELITHNRGDCITYWARESDGSWISNGIINADGNEYCAAQLVDIAASSTSAVIFPTGDGKNLTIANPKESNILLQIPIDKTLGNMMELKNAGHDLIMALFETGNILLWDIKNTTKPLSSLSLTMNEEGDTATMCLEFDKINNRGIVGGSSNIINVFNMDIAHKLCATTGTNITNPGIAAIACRADSKLLASAGWDSRLRLFAWKTKKNKCETILRPLAVLDSHTNQSLQCVAFSPTPVQSWDCKCLLATAGEACTVVMWDIFN